MNKEGRSEAEKDNKSEKVHVYWARSENVDGIIVGYKESDQSVRQRIKLSIRRRTPRSNMVFSRLVIPLELLDSQLDPRKLCGLS